MKIFNRNERLASGAAGESNVRRLPLNKAPQRHYTRAGAAIFVIIILHFVSQFIFFQSEKNAPPTEAVNHQSVEVEPEAEIKPEIEIEPENNRIDDVKTESAAKKPELTTRRPNAIQPIVQPEPTGAPSRVVIKKKEPRVESRAERLRRAERLLTGV